MPALEIISGSATAPSTTFTGITTGTDQSLTIRNTSLDAHIRLLQMWAFSNVAGSLRMRSPRMHDNVQGIRTLTIATSPQNLLPDEFMQPLIPQDTLAVEITGSAVGGQRELAQFLVYYDNLPGINGRFIAQDELNTRMKNAIGIEVDLTPTNSAGFTGAAAINANFDLTKANTDYAIMGYLVSAACGAISIKGVDTGNIRVGGPGNVVERWQTARWFMWLSQWTGIPLIPVFNSANKFGTFVECAQNQGAAAVNVTLLCAELAAA